MEPTLFSQCSSFDSPLAKVRFSFTLTISHITIWCSGQLALLLFLLAKAALAFLPTAHFVALRPPFSFRQAQYVQVFPLKPALFCKQFASASSTNKSVISLLFLSDSGSCPCHFVLFYIFPFASNSLAETAFSFLYYHATISLWTLISPGERCG